MQTATTVKAEKTAYPAYGRIFRVERLSQSGMYCGVGRGRGRGTMYLDKLGCHATEEAMQTALDAWAVRQGYKIAKHERTATHANH